MGNGLRSIFQGLTFNNADEIEAAIRAAAAGDPGRYRQLHDQLDQQYKQWADQNPGKAISGEAAGAFLPGLLAAFVPGGQGASVAAAPTVGRGLAVGARALAEPVSMAVERYAPQLASRLANSASRWGRLAMPLADEVLTGAVQSAGSAPSWQEAPGHVLQEMPLNILSSLGIRGLNTAAKKGLAVRRARREAR